LNEFQAPKSQVPIKLTDEPRSDASVFWNLELPQPCRASNIPSTVSAN
jgi:hypothetical protein